MERVKRVVWAVSVMVISFIANAELSTSVRAQSDSLPDNESAKVMVVGSDLQITPTKKGFGEKRCTIPRLFNSVTNLCWDEGGSGDLKLTPEIDYWVITWKEKQGESIRVTLDSQLSLEPFPAIAKQRADGMIRLLAKNGITTGEKLRFEPQWYKNTIGYWTVPQDSVRWSIEIDQPGDFSVGLLQGCGEGQGGSVAILEVMRGETVIATMEFETLETGHFQNFVWKNAGKISLADSGQYQVRVRPREIKAVALFDVRELHLVRQAK